MKKITLTAGLLFVIITGTFGQKGPGEWFTGKAMRFDFNLGGNATETSLYPDKILEEPIWGGTYSLPSEQCKTGSMRYDVYDSASGTLLYSGGYTTLYNEWQTTAEAKTGLRSFHEVIRFPYPKNPVRLVLSEHKNTGTVNTLYESVIDPSDYRIIHEKIAHPRTHLLWGGTSPEESLDIVFLAEGYTASQMDKFVSDANRMANALLSEEPYKSYKTAINLWAVESVSQEPGTDIPAEGIFVNTVLNASFSTFGLDRYLTTFDIKSIYDYAAGVPHDNIVVLINSERYGGGGMYNYYSCTTVDHNLSITVFLHELGHGFGGLGDEYYSSTVAYEEFYPLNVEPWEPNLTTMVDFDSKWKHLIKKGTPLPTPSTVEYKGLTGLFEGGGYMAKGIFRPSLTCRMKDNDAGYFCEVCRLAIEKQILACMGRK